jgi:hypothetical protein
LTFAGLGRYNPLCVGGLRRAAQGFGLDAVRLVVPATQRFDGSGEGEMMKSATAVGNKKEQGRGLGLCLLAAVALCIAAMILSGCSWQQPGETSAEINRRHSRMLRLNNQMMMSDVDKVLMLDRPSRLTDKRIP